MQESSSQLGFELARLVESGNDKEARALVQEKELSEADERKWLYHLGNLLHAAGRPLQASAIWREVGSPPQVSGACQDPPRGRACPVKRRAP